MKRFPRRLASARARLARRRSDERGAYAILVGMTLVLVIALAAIAVDIASQVDSKQRLKDTMDAAAHEAVFALSNPLNVSAVQAAAQAAAARNGHDGPLQLTFWCVVKATPDNRVDTDQIPSTCDPGKGPSYNDPGRYPGLSCDGTYCFLPCFADLGGVCNTVRVEGQRDVDYSFAPAIGYDKGSTGAVVSVACKGSCGDEVPNPMDVVIMADRTPSMEDDDRRQMVEGIRQMLTTMDPDLHYVSLGTMHKSKKPGDSGYSSSCIADNTKGQSGTQSYETAAKVGTWIPVGFRKDYVIKPANPTQPNVLNPNSDIVKALNCIYNQPNDGVHGTQLASGMKAAARFVLGYDGSNSSALGPRPGTVKKVVIFETDGSPDETWKGGPENLSTEGDVAYGWQKLTNSSSGSDTNGENGCKGFQKLADQAKDEGVTVITIGFGNANHAGCKRRDPGHDASKQVSPYVRNYLAAAASPAPDGGPSTASECRTSTQRQDENTDGDFYFCAASGSELADIFKTAISQATGTVRFLNMPRA